MTNDRVSEPGFDEWGWRAHETAQRRRAAATPLEAKIAWLEEAHRLVVALHGGQPERGRSAGVEADDDTGAA